MKGKLLDELELLEQLQVITDKLKNKKPLNDYESKLFTHTMLYLGMSIGSEMLKIVYDKLEGDKNEKD